jgi:hypothetical protein
MLSSASKLLPDREKPELRGAGDHGTKHEPLGLSEREHALFRARVVIGCGGCGVHPSSESQSLRSVLR